MCRSMVTNVRVWVWFLSTNGLYNDKSENGILGNSHVLALPLKNFKCRMVMTSDIVSYCYYEIDLGTTTQ